MVESALCINAGYWNSARRSNIRER